MSSEALTNPLNSCRPVEAAHGSARSTLCSLMGVQVVSTGSFAPPCQVTNDDLARLGYDSDWILQRTGIRVRRKLAPELATSDMAYRAAADCLQRADVDPDAVDLLVVATMTPDRPLPSTACLLQQRLGIRAAAMDLNAACAGFMYALTTAAQFVKTGCSRYALVVGADTNTRIVDPTDRKTFPLFGDAAGAVLLGPGSPRQGMLAYTLGAEGTGADLLEIPGGGSRQPLTPALIDQGLQFIRMDGRSVFKWAVRLLEDTIHDALGHAGLTIDEIRLVILHQANLRILAAAAENLGIQRERLFINVDRYGNTSAGSIPLGLDEACRAGQIERGDRILLCGFGAGLSWGTAILQW
jgi:3-oxoacyl-[acyl-carrier-protein] synthase-3